MCSDSVFFKLSYISKDMLRWGISEILMLWQSSSQMSSAVNKFELSAFSIFFAAYFLDYYSLLLLR